MKQLTMVINESLRLYSPVAVVSREALTDMKFGDLKVPEGVNVWTMVLTLHTDPEIWGPDSYFFNPGRFANGITGACKLPHLYMPFGVGPRVCPGQNLAMVELKILIAQLLSNFSFTLSPNYIHSPALRLVIEPEHELAAVSLTSAGLRRASLSVARRRSSDTARGLKPLPVPLLNAVDSRPHAYFLYVPSSFSRALSPPNDALLPLRQPWGSSSRTASRPTAFLSCEAADVVVGGVVRGCSCERCEGRDCACWVGDGGGQEGEEEEVVVVSECGPGCGCGLECGNRASQRGVEVRLKIARDKKKGWCLFTDQAIEKGRFVCEYAGELLMMKEARAQQKEYDELALSAQYDLELGGEGRATTAPPYGNGQRGSS
ncbi:hypothetical protein NL676_032931 [Syzygium grande]|nr:hypothetical protein NL676_032931 [Syzygium grande]